MQKVFDQLTTAFRKNSGILNKEQYEKIVSKYTTLYEDGEIIFMLLQASGYPISLANDDTYRLDTYFKSHKEQTYCIIDIETNGSKPGSSQVIEIGAVMVQNDIIIDRFETFVECAFLPEYITKITGIEPRDLIGAPSRKEALTKLRYFMKDAIFVAHNVKFDYGFLNASFDRFGLGQIGNLKLCTIDFAKRSFRSERYGLAYLIESLSIETATHHRAFSDALCAYKVMQKSLETLPDDIVTVDDLLRFSVSSQKERGLKKREKATASKSKGLQ